MLILIGLVPWIYLFGSDNISLCGLASLFNMIEYGWQNNKMMGYVEDHLYS